jgi:hypothetical protein
MPLPSHAQLAPEKGSSHILLSFFSYLENSLIYQLIFGTIGDALTLTLNPSCQNQKILGLYGRASAAPDPPNPLWSSSTIDLGFIQVFSTTPALIWAHM